MRVAINSAKRMSRLRQCVAGFRCEPTGCMMLGGPSGPQCKQRRQRASRGGYAGVTCLTPVRRHQTCHNSHLAAVNVAGEVQARPKQQTTTCVDSMRCKAALILTTARRAYTRGHLSIETRRRPTIAADALRLVKSRRGLMRDSGRWHRPTDAIWWLQTGCRRHERCLRHFASGFMWTNAVRPAIVGSCM